MFLFNVLHILHERCNVQSHLIHADSRLDALLYCAARNKFQFDSTPLVKFLETKYDSIIDRMSNNDPRIAVLEQQGAIKTWDSGTISLGQLLMLGVEVGAITEAHLERFIAKNQDERVFTLGEIAVDTTDIL